MGRRTHTTRVGSNPRRSLPAARRSCPRRPRRCSYRRRRRRRSCRRSCRPSCTRGQTTDQLQPLQSPWWWRRWWWRRWIGTSVSEVVFDATVTWVSRTSVWWLDPLDPCGLLGGRNFKYKHCIAMNCVRHSGNPTWQWRFDQTKQIWLLSITQLVS